MFQFFQLHPDTNLNKSDSEEEAHSKFVEVTEAYETLSKPKERQLYNMKLANFAASEIKSRYADPSRRYADLSKMTPEDRAKAMGFNVDPNFRYGKDTYFIAGLCVVIMVVGYVIHYKIAMISYENHAQKLNEMTARLNKEYEEVRSKAMNAKHRGGITEGNVSVRNWIMDNDNANGDELRKYDAMMARKAAARRAKLDQLKEPQEINSEVSTDS